MAFDPAIPSLQSMYSGISIFIEAPVAWADSAYDSTEMVEAILAIPSSQVAQKRPTLFLSFLRRPLFVVRLRGANVVRFRGGFEDFRIGTTGLSSGGHRLGGYDGARSSGTARAHYGLVRRGGVDDLLDLDLFLLRL